MSTKNGKRSRRKTMEEQVAFKTPASKKETMNKLEESPKLASSSEEDLKGFEAAPENGVIQTEECKMQPASPPTQTISEEETNKSEAVITVETTTNIIESEVVVVTETTEKTTTNGDTDEAPPIFIQDECDEMEPLTVDAEDVDPELQFDETSDKESHKGSPILSRCQTRRSQTRNIPTPKTPKSYEQNGDDKDSESDKATPDITVTREISLTPESSENENKIDTPDVEVEIEIETTTTTPELDLNDTRESFESAISTKVHVGGDMTREIDLSLPDERGSFLNSAKDLTVIETLRRMSSRRSIRPMSDYRKMLLKSKAEKMDHSLPLTATRSSVEKLPGMKRKNPSATPDGIKRYKPDAEMTSGFMSYISSPIAKIKNKFASSEVQASTPKLTSYRKQDILEDAEFSKIENEVNPPLEKKWCSIM